MLSKSATGEAGRAWGPNLVFTQTYGVKIGIYLPAAHQQSRMCSEHGSLEIAKGGLVVFGALLTNPGEGRGGVYVHYICRWH